MISKENLNVPFQKKGRFTLSLHYFFPKSPDNHFDLFLDRDGISALDTFRCYYTRKKMIRNELKNSAEFIKDRRPWVFTQINPHRRVYLDYAGAIKENRGRIRILRKGKFIDIRKRRHDRMLIKL